MEPVCRGSFQYHVELQVIKLLYTSRLLMGMSTYARVTPARARIDRGSDRNQFLVTDVAPVNAPQSIGLQATVENAVH